MSGHASDDVGSNGRSDVAGGAKTNGDRAATRIGNGDRGNGDRAGNGDRGNGDRAGNGDRGNGDRGGNDR